MRQFKIANILLDDTGQLLVSPTLACRSTVPFRRGDDEGTWILGAGGLHDFTTFFNALPVAKWRRYTVACSFHLHLEVRGGAFRLAQTRADSFSWLAEPVSEPVSVTASDAWHSVEMDMAAADGDVVEAFSIATEGEVEMRNGFYWADVDDDRLRPVELALCTTTFKKEDFVRRNVGLVRRDILGSDEDLASHFHLHVIDNGRTLDPCELEGPCVSVHPNPNVGGSGGFARGMIEAMSQTPRATHVLLMDDDVSISTESIFRTYNLLRIVNDAYAEAFVSGAMMSMDEPDVRWEDVGFVSSDGILRPLKGTARMSSLNEMVNGEVCEVPEGVVDGDVIPCYASWWYCVIPMSVIEREGLPLPLFVRGDDVEYSLRCHPRIMTMNGICVWHLPFHMRYSAAIERYQMTRNVFAAQATTGVAPRTDFLTEFYHNVQIELKKFNYADAELALDGFEDFLGGPALLEDPHAAEAAFMRANERAEQHEDFDDLWRHAAEQGIRLDGVTCLDLSRDVARSRAAALRDLVTVNGQRFGRGASGEGGYAVIDAAGWDYRPGKIRQKATLVAIDAPRRRGVIRHMDRERFREVWHRYRNDVRRYKTDGERIRKEYADARAELTSEGFWRRYLGLED